jgi:hypothetical protein
MRSAYENSQKKNVEGVSYEKANYAEGLYFNGFCFPHRNHDRGSEAGIQQAKAGREKALNQGSHIRNTAGTEVKRKIRLGRGFALFQKVVNNLCFINKDFGNSAAA